jgi:hypothetical protein
VHTYQGHHILRRSWTRRTGFAVVWLFLLALLAVAAAAAVIAAYRAGAGTL